jgi:hypothetical protein
VAALGIASCVLRPGGSFVAKVGCLPGWLSAAPHLITQIFRGRNASETFAKLRVFFDRVLVRLLPSFLRLFTCSPVSRLVHSNAGRSPSRLARATRRSRRLPCAGTSGCRRGTSRSCSTGGRRRRTPTCIRWCPSFSVVSGRAGLAVALSPLSMPHAHPARRPGRAVERRLVPAPRGPRRAAGGRAADRAPVRRGVRAAAAGEGVAVVAASTWRMDRPQAVGRSPPRLPLAYSLLMLSRPHVVSLGSRFGREVQCTQNPECTCGPSLPGTIERHFGTVHQKIALCIP